MASDEMVQKLIENGQIATQYVDINPNGSVYVIEGITSPDGRILGKMGHNERIDENIAINIPAIRVKIYIYQVLIILNDLKII